MHLSITFSGFIKAQVAHLHPSPEGGFSPAAFQLNPPPVPPLAVVAVFEGAEPNPVNGDPDDFGAPNENPDELVEVDEVEVDGPKVNGPEGGVGIEKLFFEPETGSEEGMPGLGASQTAHFSLADAVFTKSQVPHFHSVGFVAGGFIPAAPQSNPCEPEFVGAVGAAVVVVSAEVLPEPKINGVEGGFGIEGNDEADGFSAPPGFGASHTAHFSVIDAGFIKSQVSHFQPLGVGGFNPAAPQLNPRELVLVVVGVVIVSGVEEPAPTIKGVEEGFAAPGLGESQTAHFSVAELWFVKSQVPHFHPPSRLEGFKPAASQSNPLVVVEGTAIVFEVGKMVGLVLEPVLSRLDCPPARLHPSSMEMSLLANPLTSFSALNSPVLLPSLIILLGRTKISVGRSEVAIERTSASASFG